MSIPTQVGLQGFIASSPRLTFTESGMARFNARVGCERSRKEGDGSFTELNLTFHDLVVFGTTAERTNERLHRGDRVLASGYLREYTVNGSSEAREEFVALRIGHDPARTTYEVQRRQSDPPALAPAAEQASNPVIGL